MVQGQTEGQTSQDPAHVVWEDAELAEWLDLQLQWKQARRAFWQGNETSEGKMKDGIAERLHENDIAELAPGTTVECGDFIFTIRENRREEETVIPPYEKMGITGVERS